MENTSFSTNIKGYIPAKHRPPPIVIPKSNFSKPISVITTNNYSHKKYKKDKKNIGNIRQKDTSKSNNVIIITLLNII